MSRPPLKIAMAQVNPTVGDLANNAKIIIEFTRKAQRQGCDIVTFPELALCGYPPEDLLLKPQFVSDNLHYAKQVVKSIPGIVTIFGFVDKNKSGIYNAAAVACNHKLIGVYHKMCLPNYGVFDEKRYFKAGRTNSVFDLNGTKFAVSICEDIWDTNGPLKLQAKKAKIIFSINASPYYAGKQKERLELLKKSARSNNGMIFYNNIVGGQDELVFDGRSVVTDKTGRIIYEAKAFEEDLIVIDLGKLSGLKPVRQPAPAEEIYKALILGTRDYVIKNHFKKVAIGLSGGIDSAIVAAVAVDALGKENVIGVFMPSEYSSNESLQDSKVLAQNLGIEFKNIPIQKVFENYLKMLSPEFKGVPENIAEENLQARIRGNILMALSNKFGWLVLTTGNKSEVSTGYSTLYGDMAGGFGVIKDVPKILVYKLARYRNSLGKREIIPQRVFTKAPSAELKPNQKDSDTLAPYEVLDPILKAYIEQEKTAKDIIKSGYKKELVEKIIHMVDKSEYKRRQAAPGIKITPKAFGRDRRMPITSRYKG